MTEFYPPPPKAGSNAIGSFAIGIGQIGTVPPFQWRDTVISQYANSPILLALIESFNAAVDRTEDLDRFFGLIWNVDTAEGYGLDVWGRIVGVSRVLSLPSGSYLGFEEEPDFDPFNQSPFYDGNASTSNYYLQDQAYRRLILAKAFANITDGSIPSLNTLLIFLFERVGRAFSGPAFGFEESPDGEPFGQAPFSGGGSAANVYVADDGGMTMRYVFGFVPTPVELAIVEQSGVLPKPVGVLATVEVPAV